MPGIYDENTQRMARKLGQKPAAKKVLGLRSPVTLMTTMSYGVGVQAILRDYIYKAGVVVQVGEPKTPRAAQVMVQFHHDRRRFWLRKDSLRLD